MNIRFLCLTSIFAATLAQASPRIEFEKIPLENIGEGINAITQHDQKTFEGCFKSIIGYDLNDILTEDDPDVWDVQMRVIEIFHIQVQKVITCMLKRCDGVYEYDELCDLLHARELYDLLQKWVDLKKKWGIR